MNCAKMNHKSGAHDTRKPAALDSIIRNKSGLTLHLLSAHKTAHPWPSGVGPAPRPPQPFRHSLMKDLRSSPESPLVLASALQAFIFPFLLAFSSDDAAGASSALAALGDAAPLPLPRPRHSFI